MNESMESQKEQFTFPNIEAERGEFDRAGRMFDVDTDTLMFLAEEEGILKSLSDEVWRELDNTDSNTFGKGEWNSVAFFAHEYERNFESLRQKMEHGEILDAPIIVKIGTVYHLVSGNTRLMVARALGIAPKVLMFEYKHDRTDED